MLKRDVVPRVCRREGRNEDEAEGGVTLRLDLHLAAIDRVSVAPPGKCISRPSYERSDHNALDSQIVLCNVRGAPRAAYS
jgi:hypothetical protein